MQLSTFVLIGHIQVKTPHVNQYTSGGTVLKEEDLLPLRAIFLKKSIHFERGPN